MADLSTPLPAAVSGASTVSFHAYVMARKYDFGRGGSETWRFIAFARGAVDFPDAANWAELQAYLERSGFADEFLSPARSAWSSFTAFRSRANRSPAAGADIGRR